MATTSLNPAAQESPFDRYVMKWRAPEHFRSTRGWLWYTLAFLLNAALIAYAVWTHSWTMLMVFAFLPFVVVLEHRRQPEIVDVVISEYGIKFGKMEFPYSQIRRFWILHELPFSDELRLLTSSKLHPEITIPLVGIDPTPIRQYLVTQVSEWEGKRQSFLDLLVRILKLN